ncbi:GEVED domain-containing protein [Botrimarina mediterranea]|uniref:GEVED domain-containing protein n=1 Tax=Botrimarina mediterranea TaxID=2528022 RepID=UPI0011A149BD|nr:GEVED domain-containing protein [Botrimarina mediterranea]
MRKAPRRRDLERLEGREMMTATPGTNEYFANQWYLFANGQLTEFDPTSPTFQQTVAVAGEDINVLKAWAQGVTGAGVQIAVIDGGFDLSHEDLAAAYVLSGLTTNLDLLDGDGSPAFNDISDFLGTALAGIIAAQDNETGIVGIAHGADLFPIRLVAGLGAEDQATIDAINAAFRFQSGFIQDGNGDGIPDSLLGGALVGVDLNGDGNIDGFTQDPSLVTDVFLHTGRWNINPNSPRVALDLPTELSELTGTEISILEAIIDTARNGRATWIDTNGDGQMTPDEIQALGSIHVVPAGNDGGRINATPPFEVQGDVASSQYDRLANSIYTIAVGAVDYNGQYENPQTGVISWYSEGGSNVLLVAPSGNFRQDISTNPNLNSGIVTTDITGEGGANVGPLFNFEYDGDYFSNTNYTSGASGTEAAAAQVAAVVGLMLEANPNLSYRDVQQILMMSARQNDQFNESWIVNQMQGFLGDFEVELPQYAQYALDTDGDGEEDIEAAILPNSEYNPLTQDYVLERGFFLPGNENASIDLGVPFVYAPLPAIDEITGEPAVFFGPNGEPLLDEFGYTIPRFADNDGDLLGLAIVNPTTGEAYEVVLNVDPADPEGPTSNLYPVDENGDPIDITDPQQLLGLRVLVPIEPDGSAEGVTEQTFVELNAFEAIPGDPDNVRFAIRIDPATGLPTDAPPTEPPDTRPILALEDVAVRPIVIKTERFVLPPEPPEPEEGEEEDPQLPAYEQVVIGLLYDPNGNLFRPQAQALDDENRLAVDEEFGFRILQFAPAFNPLNGLNLAPSEVQIVGSNTQAPNPIVLFQPGLIGDGARAGLGGLVNPIVSPGLITQLQFENGAGYTVSQGYGYNLEDLSYGHGVLDAGLAVEMAKAWDTYDLYADESVTITTGILRGTGTLRVQPAVNITLPNGAVIQTVTGGIAPTANINAGYYQEFFRTIGTEEITDADDNVVGEVITEAPFFNLDDPINSNRGVTEIPFNFDPSLFEDYVSVEWLELTTNIAVGDVDHLRMALRAPDGTVTELNAFRPPAGPALAPQDPQGQQGRFTPAEEALKGFEGGTDLNAAGDFINDSVPNQIAGVDSPDAIGNGVGWTWTTNRHWGELFSSQAQSIEAPPNGGVSPTDGWTLILENHGFGEVTLGGNLEIVVHGTKATGNRIQGKVGVDDNKQGIQGTNNDENFNFNRYIEFGVFEVEYIDGAGNLQTRTQTFILDDPNDSVTYTNPNAPEDGRFSLDGIYKTVAPDTGEELYYPVINKNTYLGSRTTDDTVLNELFEPLQNFFRLTEGDPDLFVLGAINESSVDYFTGDSAAIRNATALGFYGEVPNTDLANPLVYRNFDYGQENFAAGVLVQATQYVTTFDLDGNVVSSREATGEVQNFYTGADGNYYFDVDATPAPPVKPLEADFDTPEEFQFALNVWQAVYDTWFVTYGGITYDYDISIGGEDTERIITNGGEGYFNTPDASSHGSTVAFGSSNTYTVQMFSSENRNFGETSKVTNVNFLLEIDPALTNVPVSGTVFRDRNGDGTQQPGIDESAAGVTVFYDANENGTFDPEELSAVTDATGNYSFVISGLLSPESVSIGIVDSTIPAGLVAQDPVSGFQSLNVAPGQAVDVDFTLRLGIGEPAIAVGSVFEDANQNGVRDAGEGAFTDSVQVDGQDVFISAYVDLNGNGAYDPSEPSATVRPDGTFLIETSATGDYMIRLALPSSQLIQTAPASGAGIAVTLVAGQQSTLSSQFGVYDGRIFDFGDLYVDGNSNYPTLLSDNGARHVVIPGVRLGMANDVDSDGFQSAVRNPAIDGLGDDFNGVDDEDGVRLVTATVLPNSTIQFDIMAFGAGGVLNAWFDFNNDGDWDDAGEKIFNNVEDMQVLDPLNPQFRRFTVQTPADVDTSATFYAARFRWGSAGLGYSGVANSGEVEDYLFAATAPIVISGAVRNDLDGDGVFESSDAAVPGVRVFFDRDLDGVLDADEPRAITNASGGYRLEINSTSSVNVTLRLDTSTVPTGLGPLVPIGGIFNQTIAPSTPVTSNFLVGAPQGLSGMVFDDLDNDGVRDGNEGGLANVVVEVLRDADNNGSFETIVQTTTTDAQGAYTVPLTSVGQYQVRINLGSQQFVSQTSPAGGVGRNVTVISGEFATVGNFGVHDAVPTFTFDYGDLIVEGELNYPTRLSDNGARHTIVAGSRLGAIGPDADPGSLESFNAQADDTLFSPDDEDGVVMASDIVAGSDVLIDVTATGSANDRLHAWIDFNNDGDWDDIGERITPVLGQALTSGSTTRLVVSTTMVDGVPTEIEIDPTATSYAARFRWGQGITGYTGLASTGEVEDYRLSRVLGDTIGFQDGDYNGDGVVSLADRDTWRSTYGSTSNLGADGNGDGVVNAADYSVWRDAFDGVGQASPALIVAPPADPDEYVYLGNSQSGAPALVTMPIVEDVLAPAMFDADAFAPMFLASPQVTSILDESLAVEEEAADDGDAIDAALLQWALGSAADDEATPTEYSFEEAEQEEAEEFEEAFATAFAF